MKLVMLKTVRGAEDGVTIKTYEEGKEYEIGGHFRADDLAKAFLRDGVAVAADTGVEVVKEEAVEVSGESFSTSKVEVKKFGKRGR